MAGAHVMRLPQHGEAIYRFVPDPEPDPEMLFWLRLHRWSAARLRREGFELLSSDAVLPPDAVVLCGLAATATDEYDRDAAAMVVRVSLRPSRVWPWTAQLPGELWRRSLFQLLQAWPGRRLVMDTEDVPRVREIYLTPDEPGCSRLHAAAVVGSALYAIALMGWSPEQAVRYAHEHPDRQLVGSMVNRTVTPRGARQFTWRAGRLEAVPGLEWMVGDGLPRVWRDGALLEGFLIDPGWHRYGCPRDSTQPDWVVVGGLGVHHRALRPDLLPRVWYFENIAVTPVPGEAVARALAAWPDGEKALLVDRSRLFHPNPAVRHILVGLRFRHAPKEVVKALFRGTVEAAARGVPVSAIRRRLAGLSEKELQALETLRVLA